MLGRTSGDEDFELGMDDKEETGNLGLGKTSNNDKTLCSVGPAGTGDSAEHPSPNIHNVYIPQRPVYLTFSSRVAVFLHSLVFHQKSHSGTHLFQKCIKPDGRISGIHPHDPMCEWDPF